MGAGTTTGAGTAMGAGTTTEEKAEQKAQRNAERHRVSGRLPPRQSGIRRRAGGIGRGSIRNRPNLDLLHHGSRCAAQWWKGGTGARGRPGPDRCRRLPGAVRRGRGTRQRRGGALLGQARHTQLVGVVLGMPGVLRLLTVTAVFGGEPGSGVRGGGCRHRHGVHQMALGALRPCPVGDQHTDQHGGQPQQTKRNR